MPLDELGLPTMGHWRLLQALHKPRGGQLTRILASLSDPARSALRWPHPEVMQVLDLRPLLDDAARLAVRVHLRFSDSHPHPMTHQTVCCCTDDYYEIHLSGRALFDQSGVSVRIGVRIGLLSLLACGGLVATSGPAFAICNPGRGVYGQGAHSVFDGGYVDSTPYLVTTAQDTISYYQPYVDFAHGGSVSAWPMIAQAACGPGGFAQAGQGEIWDGTVDSFYETSNCALGGGPVLWKASTGANTYTVDQSTNGGSFAIYINGTEVWIGHLNVAGDTGEYFGETHALDDQTYGAVYRDATFTSLDQCEWIPQYQAYQCYNPLSGNVGPWVTQVQQPYQAPTYMGADFSSGYMRIWDDACAT